MLDPFIAKCLFHIFGGSTWANGNLLEVCSPAQAIHKSQQVAVDGFDAAKNLDGLLESSSDLAAETKDFETKWAQSSLGSSKAHQHY